MITKNSFTIICDNCGESHVLHNGFSNYENKETINLNGFQYVSIWCENCNNRIDEEV